jgi:hypothetical protein
MKKRGVFLAIALCLVPCSRGNDSAEGRKERAVEAQSSAAPRKNRNCAGFSTAADWRICNGRIFPSTVLQ